MRTPWRSVIREQSSWKYQIDFAPVFLRGGALGGPIGRVIQLIGNLRRPEAALVAIENIALYRCAQARGATVVIGLPAGRENERTTERDVRRCRSGRRLQCDDIILNA